MAKLRSGDIVIKNKRAYFDYHFVDQYTAGIVLSGTEIKSIRLGKASLVDCYCYFINDELWAKNIHISEYAQGSYNNHELRRDRKLLLNKRELKKLRRGVSVGRMTIVPIRLFINERGYAKVVIALAQGKKEYDKRASLREKDDKRSMDRVRKNSSS